MVAARNAWEPNLPFVSSIYKEEKQLVDYDSGC